MHNTNKSTIHAENLISNKMKKKKIKSNNCLLIEIISIICTIPIKY